MHCDRVTSVQWKDLRAEVHSLNPRFAAALEGLSDEAKSVDIPFFLATFDYGDLIISGGTLASPHSNQSGVKALVETVTPEKLGCNSCRDFLAQVRSSSVPLAMVLEGSAEVFVDHQWDAKTPRASPVRLLQKGEVFGVFETLDSLLGAPPRRPPWSVSAGSRSVWILAPLGKSDLTYQISKVTKERKIRWNENRPPWELIRSVTKTATPQCRQFPWRTRILVIADELVQKIKRQDNLFNLLLEIGWDQSTALRHSAIRNAEFSADFLSGSASVASPFGELYQYLTLRHLVGISLGDAPAFRPAFGLDGAAGPFSDFVSVMQDVMRRMNYAYRPIVMQPHHLVGPEDFGYYSFRCPSVLGPKPPRVPNYSKIPASIKRALETLPDNHAIDHQKTYYFTKQGDELEDLISTIALPPADFINNGKPANQDLSETIYLSSAFLVSGMRLTRGERSVP